MNKVDIHKAFKIIVYSVVVGLLLISCVANFESNSSDIKNQQIENHIIDWERSKSHVLAILDVIPEDKLDFKSNEEVRSFSEEFKHIISSVNGMTANALDINPLDLDIESLKIKSDIADAVTTTYNWVTSNLSEFDTSRNDEVIEYFGMFRVTRSRAISKIYEHQAHHKSKVIGNQRLAGIAPPAYGMYLFDELIEDQD